MKNFLVLIVLLIGVGGVSYFAWLSFSQPDTVTLNNPVSFSEYVNDNDSFTYAELPLSTGFVPEEIPPLDTVIPQDPTPDFSLVLDAVYLDSYVISACPTGGTALMLTAKVSEDKEINDYEASMKILTEWDPYILRDVGVLLYPDERLTQVPILQFQNIDDGSVRRSDFTLNGTTRSLLYSSVLNYMVYAPTLDCLESLIHEIYAPEYH